MYLILAAGAGLFLSLVTVPVFWYARFGFVPHRLVRRAESRGQWSFLVFVHLMVGTACYVVAAGVVLLAGNLAGRAVEASPAFVVVVAIAWVGLVGWPIASRAERPRGWVRRSIGAFACYALVFWGGPASMALVLVSGT